MDTLVDQQEILDYLLSATNGHAVGKILADPEVRIGSAFIHAIATGQILDSILVALLENHPVPARYKPDVASLILGPCDSFLFLKLMIVPYLWELMIAPRRMNDMMTHAEYQDSELTTANFRYRLDLAESNARSSH